MVRQSCEEATPCHPRNLDETRGVPLRVYVRDGLCIVIFSWGAVALPEELEPKLRELVGREVACLRLDGKYHVREVCRGRNSNA